jgi:predicted CXXCH cytochrome family protein
MIKRFTWALGGASLAVLAALMFVSPAAAQDDVTVTKHNLSQRAKDNPTELTDYNEVCVYCHTPHGGQESTNAPLWNRAFGSGPYVMYDEAWSSTIDMTVAASPQGVSLACLSCHDGTIGLDVITNLPNADTTLTATGTTMPANAGQRFANLGTNLRNDHPISVTYSTTDDPAFFAPDASGKIGGDLPLYTGRVECGSCHNPHNNTNPPFLRKTNTASGLCKTCHQK